MALAVHPDAHDEPRVGVNDSRSDTASASSEPPICEQTTPRARNQPAGPHPSQAGSGLRRGPKRRSWRAPFCAWRTTEACTWSRELSAGCPYRRGKPATRSERSGGRGARRQRHNCPQAYAAAPIDFRAHPKAQAYIRVHARTLTSSYVQRTTSMSSCSSSTPPPASTRCAARTST